MNYQTKIIIMLKNENIFYALSDDVTYYSSKQYITRGKVTTIQELTKILFRHNNLWTSYNITLVGEFGEYLFKYHDITHALIIAKKFLSMYNRNFFDCVYIHHNQSTIQKNIIDVSFIELKFLNIDISFGTFLYGLFQFIDTLYYVEHDKEYSNQQMEKLITYVTEFLHIHDEITLNIKHRVILNDKLFCEGDFDIIRLMKVGVYGYGNYIYKFQEKNGQYHILNNHNEYISCYIEIIDPRGYFIVRYLDMREQSNKFDPITIRSIHCLLETYGLPSRSMKLIENNFDIEDKNIEDDLKTTYDIVKELLTTADQNYEKMSISRT